MKKHEEDANTQPSTSFKIVVPDKADKKELLEAFKYIHDEGNLDSDFIVVNQLMHEYLRGDNIIVDRIKYLELQRKK